MSKTNIALPEKYKDAVMVYEGGPLSAKLKLSDGPQGYETHYAPFDWVNTHAKIVLCGITPGLKQAQIALLKMKDALVSGQTLEDSLRSAKQSASFAGAMRNNLVRLLDAIQVHEWLGLHSTAALFNEQQTLVHYTSALRYPVFKNGKNYSGGAAMTKLDYLWHQARDYITEEAQVLPNALWVPLGPSVAAVLNKLAQQGVLDASRILDGLPHPSGANAERIKYFVGEKRREALSVKTNPQMIDSARAHLRGKVSSL